MIIDKLLKEEVCSTLNFVHVGISVPQSVTLRNVDLVVELKIPWYFLANR